MIQSFMKDKNFNLKKFFTCLSLNRVESTMHGDQDQIDLNIHTLTVSVQEIIILEAKGKGGKETLRKRLFRFQRKERKEHYCNTHTY